MCVYTYMYMYMYTYMYMYMYMCTPTHQVTNSTQQCTLHYNKLGYIVICCSVSAVLYCIALQNLVLSCHMLLYKTRKLHAYLAELEILILTL